MKSKTCGRQGFDEIQLRRVSVNRNTVQPTEIGEIHHREILVKRNWQRREERDRQKAAGSEEEESEEGQETFHGFDSGQRTVDNGRRTINHKRSSTVYGLWFVVSFCSNFSSARR